MSNSTHNPHHHDGCSCGHDHGPDAHPKLAAPLSLIAAGSRSRLIFASLAVMALWAVTLWAVQA